MKKNEVLAARLDTLFRTTEVATTGEMCRALYLRRNTAATRDISNRLTKMGYPAIHVGQNAWVKVGE